MSWTDEEVLGAVRRRLALSGPDPAWDFLGAEVVDRAVRVVFTVRRNDAVGRWEPGAFAVDYTLSDLPEGANTGEECDSPDQWADEVAWDMDEEVLTGGLRRGERSVGPDGVVRVRWERWARHGTGQADA